MEAEEKAQDRRAQLELEIRRLEIEADKAIKLRKLELEAQARAPSASITPGSTTMSAMPFDIRPAVTAPLLIGCLEAAGGTPHWISRAWQANQRLMSLTCSFKRLLKHSSSGGS
ncbi:uncharacterized protein LOC122820728 isoform X2 [Gambusia affinis]|uniref:uncharacterized protein LOC122820728 isoform X2 n=1 Tax=Gambusia affinis TaxID=33528 RepID=UPI001CDB67AF|nr:uncharacterized protein LOC122820728 isoform X2 [Gambusia affinis]XP_043954263.1 uncharacterized protein LOC122820728 isoform X2 [Gambusia affinis]XP_043954270.1 uncharacterized protein LOC122820728 isoform X2 [Gambusia affinis]XP_043954275.1 uncharacterized protein LOC122820728 isoform X2 [Gambusia affinis]